MLRISKKKLLIFWIMEYGGLTTMLVTLFPALLYSDTTLPLWLVLGGGTFWLVGQLMRDGLYRCPRCDTKLLPRRGRGLPGDKPTDFCPGCGWKVQIEKE